MPTNIQRAAVVARHVQLVSVNLVGADLKTRIDPLAIPANLELTQGHRARYELPSEHPSHIYVHVDFQLSAAPPEKAGPEEDAESVRLEATYLLIYELSEAANQPKDALGYFAELNGAYNAWPYWRELVQTVTGRVGLAAIVVPVFRPPVRELEGTPEPSASVKDKPAGGPKKKRTTKTTKKSVS